MHDIKECRNIYPQNTVLKITCSKEYTPMYVCSSNFEGRAGFLERICSFSPTVLSFLSIAIHSLLSAVTSSNRRTLLSERRLLVRASVDPSSPILVTLMMEALRSSETSVLTRATWRNIPEDALLHSHRRENLKSYIPVNNVKWTARNLGDLLEPPFINGVDFRDQHRITVK
jgi:hypothetical protein